MDAAEQQKIQNKIIEDVKAWRNNRGQPRLVQRFCQKAGIAIKRKAAMRQNQRIEQKVLF